MGDRRSLPASLLALLLMLFAIGAPAPGRAATFHVSSTLDSAPNGCDVDCTLREAVIAANGSTGADTIVVPAGTYVLTRAPLGGGFGARRGDLLVTDPVAIRGAGTDATVIDGGGLEQVFDIYLDLVDEPIAVELSDLTIRGGRLSGVLNRGEAVTLRRCVVTGNGGAGVRSAGPLVIEGSEIIGNTGREGGGIDGDVVLRNSVVANNIATEGGGGIRCGSCVIEGSTISGNEAVGDGGGVFAGHLDLRNSTVSGNHAAGNGGGIGFTGDGTDHALVHVTLSGNTALGVGSAIYVSEFYADPPILLQGVLVEGDCAGDLDPLTSLGGNLESPGDTCVLLDPTDQPGVADASLGPLGPNGGPTDTHALLPASPAIDAGPAAGCPETDQRGLLRADLGCDVGAYELGAVTPACSDGDGDGFGEPGHAACPAGTATDCDDSDPLVNPAAVEIPGDGLDNDCDPSTPPQTGCDPGPETAGAAVARDGAHDPRGAFPVDLVGIMLVTLFVTRRLRSS